MDPLASMLAEEITSTTYVSVQTVTLLRYPLADRVTVVQTDKFFSSKLAMEPTYTASIQTVKIGFMPRPSLQAVNSLPWLETATSTSST